MAKTLEVKIRGLKNKEASGNKGKEKRIKP